MSQTYIATAVLLVTNVLNLLGIDVGGEQMTTTLTTIITILSGLWIMWRRFRSGDINAFGKRV